VRRVRETPSQPAVFVLHSEVSRDLILEALRAGANEFLYPPLAETLRDAFVRLSVVRQKNSIESPGGLGRIFGFLSARGGCGATTFAAHLAPLMGRSLATPTLLADFDFDAGVLRFVMKCRAAWSVRDALDNMHRMDGNYWKKLVSPHGNLLDVLAAPEDLAARFHAGAQETAHLMRFIRSTYRAAVVDFGRHLSVSALHSLPELDTLYLIATPDPDTLDRARDCVAFIESRGYPASRVKILLNRAQGSGSFPDDREALYDAWSEGRLLDSGSKLGREFQNLSRSIAARVKGENAPPPLAAVPGPFTRVRSFFTKRVGPAVPPAQSQSSEPILQETTN